MTLGSNTYMSITGRFCFCAIHKGLWSVIRRSRLNQTILIFLGDIDVHFTGVSHNVCPESDNAS